MEYWALVSGISLAFSVPVLVFSCYTVILFLNLFRYPASLSRVPSSVEETPLVSIIIGTYNERFVISRTLDALKTLAYPGDKLQVVVADESADETPKVIVEKVYELNGLGIRSFISRRQDRTGFKVVR